MSSMTTLNRQNIILDRFGLLVSIYIGTVHLLFQKVICVNVYMYEPYPCDHVDAFALGVVISVRKRPLNRPESKTNTCTTRMLIRLIFVLHGSRHGRYVYVVPHTYSTCLSVVVAVMLSVDNKRVTSAVKATGQQKISTLWFQTGRGNSFERETKKARAMKHKTVAAASPDLRSHD